jgi:hypothetical protein
MVTCSSGLDHGAGLTNQLEGWLDRQFTLLIKPQENSNKNIELCIAKKQKATQTIMVWVALFVSIT